MCKHSQTVHLSLREWHPDTPSLSLMSNEFVVHEWKSSSTVNNPTILVISRVIFGNIRKASNLFVKVATSLMISDNLWVVFVGRSTRPWHCTDFLWTVFQPNVSLSQKVTLQISRGRLQSRYWHTTGPTIVISEHVKTFARYIRKHSFWLVRKTYTSNEFDHLWSGVLLGHSLQKRTPDRRLRNYSSHL